MHLVQTDPLIPARRSDWVIVDKVKIKGKRKERQVLWPCPRTKKAIEHVISIVIGILGTISQRLDKEVGGVKNRRTSRDHPNCSNVEVSQNSEKSPGDLRRLTVIQTRVKDCQLTLVWKNGQQYANTNCNWCAWNCPKRLGRKTGGTGKWKKNRVHPDYSTVKISQNTEKNPGDLNRLALIQTPVKDHNLMLVGKTRMEKK